jgi:uncharacterized protein YdaU (DUF1376 family)
MSAADTWMPLYVSDFLVDTTHLSTVEAGAYLLLLMGAWNRGGVLPNDDVQLGRICRCSSLEWSSLKLVLAPFFEITDTHWIQHRLLREKVKANNRCETRTRVGKLGGRPKQETNSLTNRLSGKKLTGGTTTTTCTSTNTEGESPPTPQVEFPDRFPKTEEDAINQAITVGCDPVFITSVWNKAVGRGGRDSKDVPIRVWSGYVATEWSYEQARRAKDKTHGVNGAHKVFPRDLELQRQAVQRQIDEHSANPASLSWKGKPTDLERASLKECRNKLKAINDSIANGYQPT